MTRGRTRNGALWLLPAPRKLMKGKHEGQQHSQWKSTALPCREELVFSFEFSFTSNAVTLQCSSRGWRRRRNEAVAEAPSAPSLLVKIIVSSSLLVLRHFVATSTAAAKAGTPIAPLSRKLTSCMAELVPRADGKSGMALSSPSEQLLYPETCDTMRVRLVRLSIEFVIFALRHPCRGGSAHEAHTLRKSGRTQSHWQRTPRMAESRSPPLHEMSAQRGLLPSSSKMRAAFWHAVFRKSSGVNDKRARISMFPRITSRSLSYIKSRLQSRRSLISRGAEATVTRKGTITAVEAPPREPLMLGEECLEGPRQQALRHDSRPFTTCCSARPRMLLRMAAAIFPPTNCAEGKIVLTALSLMAVRVPAFPMVSNSNA